MNTVTNEYGAYTQNYNSIRKRWNRPWHSSTSPWISVWSHFISSMLDHIFPIIQVMQDSSIGAHTSRTYNILFGVPQCSILVPLLFIFYTSNIPNVASRVGIIIHLYADDTEHYINYRLRTSPCRPWLKMNSSNASMKFKHLLEAQTQCLQNGTHLVWSSLKTLLWNARYLSWRRCKFTHLQ